FTQTLDELNSATLPSNYAFLVDFLLEKPSNLLKYLSADGLIMLDDWPLIDQAVKTVDQQNAGFIDDELKTGAILPGQELRADFNRAWTKDDHHHLYFSLFQR
ncbi:hypothetical protein CXZ08_27480, partial [Vibrio parahaemolyticus]